MFFVAVSFVLDTSKHSKKSTSTTSAQFGDMPVIKDRCLQVLSKESMSSTDEVGAVRNEVEVMLHLAGHPGTVP